MEGFKSNLETREATKKVTVEFEGHPGEQPWKADVVTSVELIDGKQCEVVQKIVFDTKSGSVDFLEFMKMPSTVRVVMGADFYYDFKNQLVTISDVNSKDSLVLLSHEVKHSLQRGSSYDEIVAAATDYNAWKHFGQDRVSVRTMETARRLTDPELITEAYDQFLENQRKFENAGVDEAALSALESECNRLLRKHFKLLAVVLRAPLVVLESDASAQALSALRQLKEKYGVDLVESHDAELQLTDCLRSYSGGAATELKPIEVE